MASPLRIGVIGCGAVAQIMHIPYLCDYDEHFQLVALATVSGSTGKVISGFP